MGGFYQRWSKKHFSFDSLLGDEGGDRGGRHDDAVQQGHGGDAQQVGEHHHGYGGHAPSGHKEGRRQKGALPVRKYGDADL